MTIYPRCSTMADCTTAVRPTEYDDFVRRLLLIVSIGALMMQAILCGAATARGAIQTKTVTYKHGDLECRGHLAWDDAIQGPRPGVLVVHEWWGLNDYARHRAEELAKLGYVAFAADMFGEGQTVDHPNDARAMVAKVRANVADWRARAAEALEVLKKQPECDPKRLAAMGYCFGGSTALQLAYTGADLRAIATFHAALPAPTEAEAKQIHAAILVNHGAADPFIPPDAIAAFRKGLDQAKVNYEFVAYPGARHSFTVADAGRHGIDGMKYDEAADKESWNKMKALFEKAFAK